MIVEPTTSLAEYARVPIAFTVSHVLDVTDRDGAFDLSERRLDVTYEKNYDAIAGEGPLEWSRRFDLANWAFFTARVAGRVVGGAAVMCDAPDLAQLRDIRVAPDARGRGVGTALFERAEAWAKLRGCGQLKVETQNTNVPACRFYEKCGCRLRAVHRAAYPDFPHEIQLLWYKDVTEPVP